MSTRTTIDFGLGVLHLNVLHARLRRQRRRIRALLITLALMGTTLLIRPTLAILMLGRGTLLLMNVAPGTTLTLDGEPLDGPRTAVLRGSHTLHAERAGFYGETLPVQITREQTTTLILPVLRERPTVQAIPLPGVDARWQSVAPDGGGAWRLSASSIDTQPTPAPYGGNPHEAAPASTLLRLDALGLTRLSALEAFGAADERMTAHGSSWAAYETGTTSWLQSGGRVTLRWPYGSAVLTPTTPITGLWWSPNGQTLLLASERSAGQDLSLSSIGSAALSAPIVSVPGRIVSVWWHPQSRAAVVLSTRAPHDPAADAPPVVWDATLLLLPSRADESPRALRLAAPPPSALGLVPLAWQEDALLWIAASDAAWDLLRIPFGAGLSTRLSDVPVGTIALRVDGEHLRLLVRDGSMLALRDGASGVTVLTIDDRPISPSISGAWQGDTLLLGTAEELWALTFSPSALR